RSVENMPAPARLWNRNFFLLWQGQTVSQLGNQAFMIAIAFWLKEATNSATLIGLLMTVSTLPGVLLAPFGGTYADRHSRIRILIACDVLAGLAVLAQGLAMHQSWLSVHGLIVLLFFVAIFDGALRAFFMPAINSAIPDLVPGERLAAANSLNQFSIQTAVFAGQAVGGVLFRLLGAPLLLIADGITFLFAAGSATFIADPFQKPPAETSSGSPFRAFLHETAEGLRWVWQRAGMRDFVLVASLLNFFVTPILVLFPFYVQDVLKAGAEWYGFLLAATSVGAVAGFLLAGVVHLRGAVRGWTLVALLVLGPVLLGAIGFIHIPLLAVACSFLSGMAFGMVNIYLLTLLQAATPPELRGRVLGLLGTLGGGLMPIGLALGGWLGDLTHHDIPLLFGGSAALSALVTLALATRKECRAFLAQDA
ncbi:MAG TPA: MFS transporter, partial [Thermoanaerobaculia bacterium]